MRRDAIRMKTRNAVSLKPNPSGGFSAYMPTIRSTLSGCPWTSRNVRASSGSSVDLIE